MSRGNDRIGSEARWLRVEAEVLRLLEAGLTLPEVAGIVRKNYSTLHRRMRDRGYPSTKRIRQRAAFDRLAVADGHMGLGRTPLQPLVKPSGTPANGTETAGGEERWGGEGQV